MKAGNHEYKNPGDLPSVVPVFPLSGALLLPGGQLPLNIFEPRYLAMVDDALASDHLIGMIQPDLSGASCGNGPALCGVGCLGRITGWQELGDGRYLISLGGICRFSIEREEETIRGYRRARIRIRETDLDPPDDPARVDRQRLLATFRRYLEVNGLETDWESVNRADNETLVTALSMMSPYGPAEKQALLEACDLRERAETLIAIAEIEMARKLDGRGGTFQ